MDKSTEKKERKGGYGCLSTVISLTLLFLIAGGVWYFFGKITITTTLDGTPINGALVEVEGVEECQTPCELRLETGTYELTITPPAGTRTREASQTLTVHAVTLITIGRTFNIPFRSRGADATRTPSTPPTPRRQRRR